jgi:NDP-sugar pyrophosphorylase family protein
VQDRETSRYLLFDQNGKLCGRRAGRDGKAELVRPASSEFPLAFSGIHIISPQLFAKMKDEGIFSIIAAYMHLASHGENIVAFRADDDYWRDLGRPENIAQAAQDMASGAYPDI